MTSSENKEQANNDNLSFEMVDMSPSKPIDNRSDSCTTPDVYHPKPIGTTVATSISPCVTDASVSVNQNQEGFQPKTEEVKETQMKTPWTGGLLYGARDMNFVHQTTRVGLHHTAFWNWMECFCSYVLYRIHTVPVIVQHPTALWSKVGPLDERLVLTLRSFVDNVTQLKHHWISAESKWLHEQAGVWSKDHDTYERPTIPLLERIVREFLSRVRRDTWNTVRPTLANGAIVPFWDSQDWKAIVAYIKTECTEKLQWSGTRHHEFEYIHEGEFVVARSKRESWIQQLWSSAEYIRVSVFPGHHLPHLRELLGFRNDTIVAHDPRFLNRLPYLSTLDRVSQYILSVRDKPSGTGARSKGISLIQLQHIGHVVSNFLDTGPSQAPWFVKLQSAINNPLELDKALDILVEQAFLLSEAQQPGIGSRGFLVGILLIVLGVVVQICLFIRRSHVSGESIVGAMFFAASCILACKDIRVLGLREWITRLFERPI